MSDHDYEGTLYNGEQGFVDVSRTVREAIVDYAMEHNTTMGDATSAVLAEFHPAFGGLSDQSVDTSDPEDPDE